MTNKDRQRLSGPLRTLVGFWVGVGFTIVGLYQALTPHAYPPGDFRAASLFWPLVGLATATIGVIILILTARTAWKNRRDGS